MDAAVEEIKATSDKPPVNLSTAQTEADIEEGKKSFKKLQKIRVQQDEDGKYIDQDKDKMDKNLHEIIMSKIDKTLKIDGMSEKEFNKREAKEAQNLEELTKKESELVSADKDIKTAESNIKCEKEKIDQEIKNKLGQTENLKQTFAQKKAAREEAARKE